MNTFSSPLHPIESHSTCTHDVRGHVHGFVLSSWSHVGRLTVVFCLNLFYGGVEWWGAKTTHSWALMSDAAHMASDASGLLLALLAAVLSVYVQKSHHFQQAWWVERLASTVNAIGLWGMSAVLWQGGLWRLSRPVAILAEPFLWIAVGGLLINFVAMLFLHQAQSDNLNLRGAYLHLFSDLLGSVAAIVSALCILFFQWAWMDAVMSLLVAGLMTIAAFQFSKNVLKQWKHPASEHDFQHPLCVPHEPH
ncbi:MAG: cation transporter [Vampirovibrio sp.]